MKYMKKLFIILFLVISTNILKVQANEIYTLERNYEEDYFFVMKGENFYLSEEFPFYTINNKVVYCLDPISGINNFNYVEHIGLDKSPYNNEINSKLELIGRYGYDYFGHDTINYRLATQELIWEITKEKEVNYYTAKYGYGKSIDVSNEKDEIMTLVNNHYTKPSFDKQTINIDINKEIILEDENYVLEGYEVYDDGGNLVEIKENNIHIKTSTLNNSKIKLRRKKYDNLKNAIFVSEDIFSKKLGLFRNEDEITSEINLNAVGSKLKVIHVDNEEQEIIKIKGIKFKIKDLDNDKYICENENCIFETNEYGEILTKLSLGNYQLEQLEDQFLYNYLWNDETLIFSINEENIKKEVEIIFESSRAKGSLELLVKGEKLILENDTFNYEQIILENAIYGLYANEDIYVLNKIKYKKDELIKELKTSELGKVYIDNLELGKYHIKQISSNLDNIIDDNKYIFEIKKEDSDKKLEFKNFLPKATVEYKIDNNNLNENILIEIYLLEEKNLIYKENITNQEKIKLTNLPLGKYIIKEIINNKENKNIVFELNEDKEITKLGFDNKLIFEVPNTLINEKNITLIIGIILMTIGIGWYIYAKKK